MDYFDWAREHLKKWKAGQQATDAYWDRLTPRVIQVFALAHEEAIQMRLGYVGGEHLLLGLLKLGNGVAGSVLIKLGLTVENVREEMLKMSGGRPVQNACDYVPLTPRAKKIYWQAAKQATAMNHTYVGTEHLLIGLLGESEGLAARIFQKFNLDREKLRQEILKEIQPSLPPGNAGLCGKLPLP